MIFMTETEQTDIILTAKEGTLTLFISMIIRSKKMKSGELL